MRMNLPVSNTEYPVPEGGVLVSKTDLKGVITYCNRTFCEVSGYSERELVGAPHNLVRHPEVPAAVFADCWKTVQAGNPWNGVIKNRRKNGDYYWVEANVTPLIEAGKTVGYVSLRYKATAAQIAAAERSYQALREGGAVQPPDRYAQNQSYIVLQQRLAEKIVALEKYHDSSEEELRIGSDIMMRITRMNGTLDPIVRQKIRPAAHYSGDMILAARTPADVLHIMLADAVGHGLTAAMNVLPLSQAFYAMSKKGFGISRIAEELNLKIHNFMPVDRFVAALLISIDFRSQVVEVWNGGNPAPVLVDAEGEILYQWKSSNLPLGIFGKQDFTAGTEVFHYEEDCQLFLFSDGLPEAESPSGIPFSKERIEVLLQHTAAGRRFDELIGALEYHLCGRPAHDDVSLAMVSISCAGDPTELSCQLSSQRSAELGSDWRVAISLGANELKYVEVVPMLTQVIARIHATREHHSALFLILSELFNNALDHGVLQLDSSIKLGHNGFDRYLQLRDERLRVLDHGKIDLEIEKAVIEGRYGVKIRVVDSGSGFDHAALRVDADNQIELAQHGRGIALVKSLASKLEFAGRGNEVVAYYVCA